jgi:hypothetical protein
VSNARELETVQLHKIRKGECKQKYKYKDVHSRTFKRTEVGDKCQNRLYLFHVLWIRNFRNIVRKVNFMVVSELQTKIENLIHNKCVILPLFYSHLGELA